MCANIDDVTNITSNAINKAVASGNSAFKEVIVTFHLFCLQGGIAIILKKEGELFFGSLLDVLGELCKCLPELVGLDVSHEGRELRNASGLSNSWIRSFLISSSAFR